MRIFLWWNFKVQNFNKWYGILITPYTFASKSIASRMMKNLHNQPFYAFCKRDNSINITSVHAKYQFIRLRISEIIRSECWSFYANRNANHSIHVRILNGKTDFENQLRVVKQSIWLRWYYGLIFVMFLVVAVAVQFRMCVMVSIQIERHH